MIVNPQYYKIPRAKVEGYQNGKVLLNISHGKWESIYKKTVQEEISRIFQMIR
jgi:hypothetical protein